MRLQGEPIALSGQFKLPRNFPWKSRTTLFRQRRRARIQVSNKLIWLCYYDPQTGLIFAVAEIQGPAHILVGIDARTGQLKDRRSADPVGIDARVEQERRALALFGGRVYIPY